MDAQLPQSAPHIRGSTSTDSHTTGLGGGEDGISLCDDGNILELGSGADHTTLCIYANSPMRTL